MTPIELASKTTCGILKYATVLVSTWEIAKMVIHGTPLNVDVKPQKLKSVQATSFSVVTAVTGTRALAHV